LELPDGIIFKSFSQSVIEQAVDYTYRITATMIGQHLASAIPKRRQIAVPSRNISGIQLLCEIHIFNRKIVEGKVGIIVDDIFEPTLEAGRRTFILAICNVMQLATHVDV